MNDNGMLVGVGSSKQEAFRGLICGILFGITSPIIGHPFDCLKTKMQTQQDYMSGSAIQALKKIIKQEGFFSLYKGLLPPLIGSSLFRSIQFSAYAFAYGSMRDRFEHKSLLVILSSMFAATCRSLIEQPLEFIKVRKQTSQNWILSENYSQAFRNPFSEIKNLFKGFFPLWIRSFGLLSIFFSLVSYLETYHREFISQPLMGSFVKGSLCASIAWIVIWPFDLVKNQIQANLDSSKANMRISQRFYIIVNQKGVLGLYRGIGPGLSRSLIANGPSMMIYNQCQSCFRGQQQNV